jgi:hypothetical protein
MAEKYHHGNSPAAWATVIIIMIAFCVGGAFTVMAEPVAALAAGGGILVLGGIVGLILRAMGLGQETVTAPSQAAAGAEAKTGTTAEAKTGTATGTTTATVVQSEAGADGAVRVEPQQAPAGG